MVAVYDERGIRFEFPQDWELEVTEDESLITVSVSAPSGLAFAFVTTDEDCPDPDNVANEALEALREEYPTLDATEAFETIDGHPATGHDVEFISLDITNSCSIRSFRTPRRTVLVFGQWSDLEDEDIEGVLRGLRRSLEETDSEE